MERTLIKKLTEGENKYHKYPVTPDEAAAMIVAELLSDLPPERQGHVREAIGEWGCAWGSSVSSTDAESSHY